MDKMYFTITGLCYRFGNEVFEKGMTVRIEKEPDNEFDKEAIKVMIDGLGKVGYVANSPKTVRGESFSAGRLYDKIDDIIEFYLPFENSLRNLVVIKKVSITPKQYPRKMDKIKKKH